jgi:hypothetical protein
MSETPPLTPRPRRWTAVVLTVSGVLLFLAAVTALQLWWFQREAARQADEIRERIENAMAQAEQAVREDQIDRALAILEKAAHEERAPDELRQEVIQIARGLLVLQPLQESLLECWRLDRPGGTPFAIEARESVLSVLPISSRRTRYFLALSHRTAEHLARRLDEQFALLEPHTPAADHLNEFDDDPQRCEARSARGAGSPTRVQTLAKKVDLETITPRLAILLGSNLNLPNAYRVQLLQRAHGRFPEDVPIAVLLGWALGERDGGLQPADATKLVSCFRAVTVRHPESPVAWFNLGYVLAREGKDFAANRVAFRRSILNGLDKQDWLSASAFAAIRDPESLAKLPENERKEWQKFWGEVRDLQPGAEK